MSDQGDDITYPLEGPTSTTVIVVFIVIIILSIGAFSITVLCSCFQCPLTRSPDVMRLLTFQQARTTPDGVVPDGVLGNHVDQRSESNSKQKRSSEDLIDFVGGDGAEVRYSVSCCSNGCPKLDTIAVTPAQATRELKRCRSASPVLQNTPRECDILSSSLYRSKSDPSSLNTFNISCSDRKHASACESRSFTRHKSSNPPTSLPSCSNRTSQSQCGDPQTDCNTDPLSFLVIKKPPRVPLKLSISRDLRGHQHSAGKCGQDCVIPEKCGQDCTIPENCGQDCVPRPGNSSTSSSRGCASGGCCIPSGGVSADSYKSHTTYRNKPTSSSNNCQQSVRGAGECSTSREFTHSKEYDDVFTWSDSVSINMSQKRPTETVVEIHNLGRDESEPYIDYSAAVGVTLDDLERHIAIEDSTSPSEEDYFSTHSEFSLDERRLSQRRSKFFSLNSLTNHIGFLSDSAKSSERLLKKSGP